MKPEAFSGKITLVDRRQACQGGTMMSRPCSLPKCDMAANVVASNELVKRQAESLRTLLNSGLVLKLFKNDFHPSVTDTLASYSEATFPGYAPVTMTGLFKPVFKVQDGNYATSSSDVTFTAVALSAQEVFGWYLTDGSKVFFSLRLPFSVTVTLGSPLTIRVDGQAIGTPE